MDDCVGKRLHIGDNVICSDMYYADLLIGEIIGFTPMKARVRYRRSSYDDGFVKETLKESYQIFRVNKEDVCNV